MTNLVANFAMVYPSLAAIFGIFQEAGKIKKTAKTFSGDGG